MHLEKKDNGVWCVRIKREDGSWTRRSLRTTSKREAQKRLGTLDLDTTKQERLEQAVQRWLRQQEDRTLTEKHLRDLERIAEELTAQFGARPVEEVRRGHLLP